MKAEVELKGMAGVLETLKSLPYEIVAKRGGPVKLALKKGAQLIRDEEKRLFESRLNERGWNDTTGLLKDSIIASRGKPPTEFKGERYVVRFRRRYYTNRNSADRGSYDTTIKVAQLFEYGSSHQPPRQFIRTAFANKAEQAMQLISEDLIKRIDLLVRKLAKQNEGKK